MISLLWNERLQTNPGESQEIKEKKEKYKPDEGRQYSETNVMHLSFSLSRIKCLYMFRALLAHPQEALSKRHLVYYVRVVSIGCTKTEVEAAN
jgi:hypothetical protein